MTTLDEPETRSRIRTIIDEVIRPNADKVDRDAVFPGEALKVLAAAGWNSVTLPHTYGGLGLGHAGFALAADVNGHQELTHLGHDELTHPGGPGRVALTS